MKMFTPFLVLLFCFCLNPIHAQKHELTKYQVWVYKKDAPKKLTHVGRLNSLEDNAIGLSSDFFNNYKNSKVPFDDIYLLRYRKRGRVVKSILVGMTIGALTGLALCGGKQNNCEGNFLSEEVVFSALTFNGALFGGLLGSIRWSIKLGPSKDKPKRVKEKILEVL